MKIAVPVNGRNQVDEHFGHCEYYNIYTISESKQVAGIQTIQSEQGCGCKSDIAFTLAKEGVSIMLAGGIGGGAINVLNSAGIEVVRGCGGDAAEVVNAFLNGNISDSGSSCEQHEQHHAHGEHEHKHNCQH